MPHAPKGKLTNGSNTGSLHQTKELYSADGTEHIKLHPLDGSNSADDLPYSGSFHNGHLNVVLHWKHGLMSTSNNYVAKVHIKRIAELDHATDFKQAKAILEQNLRVSKVLLDDDLRMVEEGSKEFETHMTELTTNSFENPLCAQDLYHLGMLLRNFNRNTNPKELLKLIVQSSTISDKTKETISHHVKVGENMEKRQGLFGKLFNRTGGSGPHGWVHILEETVRQGAATHRQKLQEQSPPKMKDVLVNLPESNVFFVTKGDWKLFSDLVIALDNDVFRTFWPKLMKKYCTIIRELEPSSTTRVEPITNRIYFYLFKSLWDVLEDVKPKAKNVINVQYDTDQWMLGGPVCWKTASPSLLDRCLECELRMILNMINHFEPGKQTVHKHFTHKFRTFENIDSQLPIELHVWLCLLDDTFTQVFSKDKNIKRLCSSLLTLYKNLSASGASTMDSMESLRVISHNTIRFVALAGPFLNSKFSLDGDILLGQIDSMSRTTGAGQASFLDFRDQVEVFAQYWKQRSEFAIGIAAKLSEDYFKDRATELQNILLQCVSEALKKRVDLTELINFCRAFEELLVDLLDLQLDWYVRPDNGKIYETIMKKGALELVDNKWQDSEHKCYRVVKVEKFVMLYLGLSDEDEMPRHYVLETIKLLVNSIYNMMIKQHWHGGEKLSESEQINSSALMISSIRSCLLYLCEQPDYIDYDQFLQENSKPFETVSNESTSYEDFKKRAFLIKESFWYIRNLNAITIETALDLFRSSNQGNYNEEYLRAAYAKYCNRFELYMGQNKEMNTECKIDKIIKDLKASAWHKLTSSWSFEFKQNVLPEVLAAMGAVWALHASKDVASTGQYLKPHCIQVVGVLRLLGTDNNSQGVQKHLAQILTGQGKSLVLGMAACTLALCGHSVLILCYSEYLASRDEQDFEDFYNYFSVRSMISYKTFGEAATDEFLRVSGNAKAYIHKCLGIPFKEETSQVANLQNPVLLIDEVDVFFNENLYGAIFALGTMPVITGLDVIQREIWRLVTSKTPALRQAINTFISTNNSKEVVEFRTMLNRPGTYQMLEERSDQMNEKSYDNAVLVSNHINLMIKTAEIVHKLKESDDFLKNFRLSEQGNISLKTSFGMYSEDSYCGYYNTFVYFRLKGSNFERGKSNYGYLVLDLGCTSYAKLPESYPLILGVTGTLTTLSQYENKVIKEYYKITDFSVMPSFFGTSNLVFDESKDVTCCKTETDWLNTIFSQINTIIKNKRSVLVIFDTEETINTFRQQFAAQFDRLNVLTINTHPDEKEKFITESGVSRTITLATREMGRGVDYKSSVAVEKNGGVHVIQTFYSLDIKEETQIKGRTARKDNRGSYEMVLCYDDLVKMKLNINRFESGVSYRQLSDARTVLNLRNYDERDVNVKKANEKHSRTVEFYSRV
ncbi:hypothetical protein pipiens_013472 [Culex pipiens pipiens]|uniref:SecA family profile domain-containing protein n=1 Tax=Culex pipiens pipiens TaxID=38569 RepID=A0ABD1CYH5_CULPP